MAKVPLEGRYFRVEADRPVLLGARCASCELTFYPARRLCAVCRQPVSPVELSRRGTLYAYTWVETPVFGRHQVDGAGYGVGQVDLPEGVRLQTVLSGDRRSWQVGAEMEADLDVIGTRDDDEVVLYRFAPVEDADRA